MNSWTVMLETEPDLAIRKAVLAPLAAYNRTRVGDSFSNLAVTVRNSEGAIIGGLWGHIWCDFLFVELLTTGEARGNGLGRQVMALAEAEARRRGCLGIWLDTFTFQAPDFYAKLGFEEFGRIADYPAGQDRIFLLKRLNPEAGMEAGASQHSGLRPNAYWPARVQRPIANVRCPHIHTARVGTPSHIAGRQPELQVKHTS